MTGGKSRRNSINRTPPIREQCQRDQSSPHASAPTAIQSIVMRKLEGGLAVMILFAGLAGCGSGQPLRVSTIQLGRSLNPDNTVASFTTVFTPTDTVYLSALTTGVGSARLGVRWTYSGQVIGTGETGRYPDRCRNRIPPSEPRRISAGRVRRRGSSERAVGRNPNVPGGNTALICRPVDLRSPPTG